MTISKEHMFSCARISIEVDLEKWLLEAIVLTIDNWKHKQPLDYHQLPFKCKTWHGYDHFEKYYKNNAQPTPPTLEKEDQGWMMKMKMNPQQLAIALSSKLTPSTS